MIRNTVSAALNPANSTEYIHSQPPLVLRPIPNGGAESSTCGATALKAIVGAGNAISSLTRQDQESIKLLVSEIAGSRFCVEAHTISGAISGINFDSMRRIRAQQPSGNSARDALMRFVALLQRSNGPVPIEEMKAVKAAGYTDAQITDAALAIAVTTFTNLLDRISDSPTVPQSTKKNE